MERFLFLWNNINEEIHRSILNETMVVFSLLFFLFFLFTILTIFLSRIETSFGNGLGASSILRKFKFIKRKVVFDWGEPSPFPRSPSNPLGEVVTNRQLLERECIRCQRWCLSVKLIPTCNSTLLSPQIVRNAQHTVYPLEIPPVSLI